MAKLELFYRNYISASCDGGCWGLSLDRTVLDGREVVNVFERDDLLKKAGAEDSYEYFHDNVAEYGVPDSTLKIGPVELDVQTLADGADWDDGGEEVHVEILIGETVGGDSDNKVAQGQAFRRIYYDGCNGWCLGDIVEATPNEEGVIVLDDQEFGSRNDDGLYEDLEEGQSLLVPCG
jgi:hypothetical protein